MTNIIRCQGLSWRSCGNCGILQSYVDVNVLEKIDSKTAFMKYRRDSVEMSSIDQLPQYVFAVRQMSKKGRK